MKKCTHAKCLKDVLLEGTDIILFKKDEVYRVQFDYKALLYYAEPEFQEDADFLPSEFAISAVSPHFQFFRLDDERKK